MEKNNPTVIITNPANGETQILTHLTFDEVWEVLQKAEKEKNEKSAGKEVCRLGTAELGRLDRALDNYPKVREFMEDTVGVNRIVALAMKSAEDAAKNIGLMGQTIEGQVEEFANILENSALDLAQLLSVLAIMALKVRNANPEEFEDIPEAMHEKLAKLIG